MKISREELIKILRKYPNSEFQKEIANFVSFKNEKRYDEISAIFDLMDDCEFHSDNGMLDLCRRVLIRMNFYRIMTEEELKNFSGKDKNRPWIFKLNKVPYTTEYKIEDWKYPQKEDEYA